MQKNFRFGFRHVLYIVLLSGFTVAIAQPLKNKTKTTASIKISPANDTKAKSTNSVDKTDAEIKREQESAEAFKEAYKVLMHPRCMNCHPKGDAPLQGDDSHIHTQNVTRGPDGKGVYAMKCSNCHQSEHVPGQHMPPGHALWHLPPANRKMVFEGKTPAQLAAHFKDNNFTGFKDFKKDLLHHVEHEPLVLNSWTYGTPPPLSHEEFVSKVKEWIDKGAVVPK
ncbi:hypothetical protein [Terrimonas alba]|uniref:hypothetical protein n=1 Tax=Terrimonas alba TaxID=3349636 RepID=UPI0035F446AE